MAKHIVIDGKEYEVPIAELKRRADILDKYAHRSEDGNLHREVIGTYYNYELKIGVQYNKELYNELFEVLSAPVDSHMVIMPNDGIQFEGYFSSISDTVLRIEDDGTLYNGLSCKFTATKPRRIPESSGSNDTSGTAGFDDINNLTSG